MRQEDLTLTSTAIRVGHNRLDERSSRSRSVASEHIVISSNNYRSMLLCLSRPSFLHSGNRQDPGFAECGHDRDGPLAVEGEVGLRARFRCCRRPFPASPLPHPACPSQGTGRPASPSQATSDPAIQPCMFQLHVRPQTGPTAPKLSPIHPAAKTLDRPPDLDSPRSAVPQGCLKHDQETYWRRSRGHVQPPGSVGAVPQTAPISAVTRRHKSGLLNFALHSPEDDHHDRRRRSARLQLTGPKGLLHYRTMPLCVKWFVPVFSGA